MSIQVAKSAGFCFGVNRAVEMVYRLLEEGKQVYTWEIALTDVLLKSKTESIHIEYF